MAQLAIHELTRRYGDLTVVNGVSLDISHGEFLVLLGPSGCGKTTTLRMVAGFVQPSSGSIHIGQENVTHRPPWKRNCGLVFQNYALFPHMTVAQNVAFGLEMRKVEKSQIEKRVREALRMVRLDHLEHRYPREMSGGQQQRVALARALAIQPDVLLLDEPLSNLDAKLREEVRIEIRELQRKLGLTTILVTHDQEEALTVADRLVVMQDGHVRQIGTKRDLYERPADRFVASFIGRSCFNEGVISHPGRFETEDGLVFKVDQSAPLGPASLALRPERFAIGPGAESMDNHFRGNVEFVSYLGSSIDAHIRLGASTKLVVQFPNKEGFIEPAEGDDILIGWARTAGLIYPRQTGPQAGRGDRP
jgi:putative spermidine/putrescine transport system ATP-binding protein